MGKDVDVIDEKRIFRDLVNLPDATNSDSFIKLYRDATTPNRDDITTHIFIGTLAAKSPNKRAGIPKKYQIYLFGTLLIKDARGTTILPTRSRSARFSSVKRRFATGRRLTFQIE